MPAIKNGTRWITGIFIILFLGALGYIINNNDMAHAKFRENITNCEVNVCILKTNIETIKEDIKEIKADVKSLLR